MAYRILIEASDKQSDAALICRLRSLVFPAMAPRKAKDCVTKNRAMPSLLWHY
jgi:hypothetical protein